MSVLIKGIDMPTKGNPITVLIYPDGTAEWEAQNKVGAAIPVPPHGDLIDVNTVDLADGPYEYDEWVEWAFQKYLDAPVFLPADPAEEGE